MTTKPVPVKTIDIKELRADPKNARKHGDRNKKAIKASLETFGAGRSLVVDKNGVIRAGNGTVEQAIESGFEKVVVVEPDAKTLVAVQRSDWSTEQAMAYALADNRSAELAEWDGAVLDEVIQSIPGFDLGSIGFTRDEYEKIIANAHGGAVAGDDIPDEVEAKSTTGQIWLLGEHRVLCGDSRKASDVDLVVDGGMADAVLTDPPYGVEYVGKTKDQLTIQNDGADDLMSLLKESFDNAFRVCHPGGSWFVAAPAGPQFLDFAVVLRGLKIWRQTIVWVKDTIVLGRSDYHYRHEPIFYGWKPGESHIAPKDRKQSSVWEFDRPKASREHPTMKPVALYAKAMEDTVPKHGIVYDPFLGSGTTLLAAEQTGRTCYGIEIAPKYVDVIISRWENLTGRKAELK